MKMKLSVTLALFFIGTSLFAQSNYKQSIGLRLGSGYYDIASVSYKTFMSEKSAIEINAGIRPYSLGTFKWTNASVSGTFQYHFPIKPVDGLKWFVGGGVVASNTFSNFDAYRGFGLGIYPTAGADYKFSKIPLAVSADIRPTFNVIEGFEYTGYNNFYPNAGISARYTF